MKIKKIIITEEYFNLSIRNILISLGINPEVVLVKINNKFTPISTMITKETELEILEVVKN